MSGNVYHFEYRYADGSVREFNARLISDEKWSSEEFSIAFEPTNEPADSGTIVIEVPEWRAS